MIGSRPDVLFGLALGLALSLIQCERPPLAASPRDVIDPWGQVDGAPSAGGADRERLSFSNTMEWDEELLVQLSTPAPTLGSEEELLSIPPPPATSSERTHAELELLRSYRGLRTPARIREIRAELRSEGLRIGPTTLGQYLKSSDYTFTSQVIRAVLVEVYPIIFHFKKRFDRVRPHMLDKTLAPVIHVPGHPAYPSGHSTQAHLVAFALAEIAPTRRADFERDALRIAVNREIAGVHYPSDTAAGALLARQVLDRMLQKPAFAKLVMDAKPEWQ